MKRLHKEERGDKKRVKNGWWDDNNGKTFIVPYKRSDTALVTFTRSKTVTIQDGIIYPLRCDRVVSRIPENIPLDEEFGFFVGLYLAEGWSTNTFVGISNNEPYILDKIKKWCDSYKITYHTVETVSKKFEGAKSTDLKIHSVIIARLFKKWMGTGSANKKVPTEAFIGCLPFVKGVLDGYMSGDGTVNKRDKYIVVSSASEELLEGILCLCTRFGIFGKLSSHQPKKNNVNIKRCYTLSIRNKWVEMWRDCIGFTHKSKSDLLKEVSFSGYGRYYNPINDIVLDPIVSIDAIPEEEHPFVYDLTVPSTTNFAIFNGLCCADTFHHAGHGSLSLAGVPRMTEIMNATEEPKQPVTKIYFETRPKTIEELPHKYDIRHITFGHLIDFVKVMPKPDDPWYHVYESLFRELPEDAKCIRITLDKDMMFRSRISVMDVYKIINNSSHNYKREHEDVLTEVKNSQEFSIKLWAVPGPLYGDSAYIDIYTKMDLSLKDKEISKQSQEIIRLLNGIHVKGVKGVYDVFYSVETNNGVDEWYIQALGHKEDKVCTKPKILDILCIPGVDVIRTVTDDLRDIERTLGIEAVRHFLTTEVERIISGGGTVHPAHYKLLADSMTYLGRVTSVSRHGTDVDEQGAISLMTFEEPIKHIRRAAQFGYTDRLNGVSGCVMTGTLAPIGTGSMGQFIDFGGLMYAESAVSKLKTTKIADNVIVKERREDKIATVDEILDEFSDLFI